MGRAERGSGRERRESAWRRALSDPGPDPEHEPAYLRKARSPEFGRGVHRTHWTTWSRSVCLSTYIPGSHLHQRITPTALAIRHVCTSAFRNVHLVRVKQL